MSSLSQDGRLLQIDTPLSKPMILTSIQGEERLNALFHFELLCLSASESIDPTDLIGKPVTAQINSPDNPNETRYFNGFVKQISSGNKTGEGLFEYRLGIAPSLWVLTQSEHHRIWEKATVIDILKEVTATVPHFRLDNKTTQTYVKRAMCMQFGESDFDFITRLLAEEGINYHFTHAPGQHTVVLTDANAQLSDCRSTPLPFIPQMIPQSSSVNAMNSASTRESHSPANAITQWDHQYHFHAGVIKTADYNEQTPSNALAASTQSIDAYAHIHQCEKEQFYSYLFEEGPSGQRQLNPQNRSATAKRQMEAIEAESHVIKARSTCFELYAGGCFQLSEHSNVENQAYLVTHIKHHANDGNRETSYYQNSVQCQPKTIEARPKQVPKPLSAMPPQTAKVIEVKPSGAKGNAFAEVKVEFFWNSGKKSCWARVGQQLAGNQAGTLFIPKVGQEVMVAFINGQSDRPIVTSALYNAKQVAPAYTETQSGIRTGDQQYNEIRFDDKANQEELFVKAGKDLNIEVNNDQTVKIENDQTIHVKQHRSIQLDEGNEKHTLAKGDFELDIGGASDIKAKKAIQIASQKEIELKVGASSLSMKSSGITLKMGNNKIVLNNSGITINGLMVKLNGSAMTEVKGGGMVKVKGGIAMIN